MILHCFHLADSLTSLWGLGQTRDLRSRSVSSEAHEAAFCFTLRRLLPPPNVIMLPTHPITRSRVAHAGGSKQRRHGQGCKRDRLAPLAEPTATEDRCLPGKEKNERAEGRNSCYRTVNLYCSVTMKSRGNQIKITRLCEENNMG